MSHNKARRKPSSSKLTPKVVSLALIGAGFLILGAVLLIVLPKLGAGAQSESGDYPSAIPVKVNYPAPEIELADLQGKPVSLVDYRGKVVLVNNWAFWCPPCRAELPVLEKYYQEHKTDNFTIVGIEAGGEFEDVDYHVKLYKLTFPIWMDPGELALRTFNNLTLPNSYVIDANGQVVYAWSGPISRAMLEQYITPLLESQ